jgi:hypothetical protein
MYHQNIVDRQVFVTVGFGSNVFESLYVTRKLNCAALAIFLRRISNEYLTRSPGLTKSYTPKTKVSEPAQRGREGSFQFVGRKIVVSTISSRKRAVVFMWYNDDGMGD